MSGRKNKKDGSIGENFVQTQKLNARGNELNNIAIEEAELDISTTIEAAELDTPSSNAFSKHLGVDSSGLPSSISKVGEHKLDSLDLPSMSPPPHSSTTMNIMDSLDLPSSSHFRPLIDVKGKQHKVDSLDLPSMSPPLHFSTTMDRQNRVDCLRSKSPPLHSSTTMDSLDLPSSSHLRPLIDVKGKQHKVDSLDLPSMSPPLHFSTTMDRQNRVDCLRSKSPPLHSSTTMDSLDLPSSSHLRPLIDVKGKQHKVDSLDLPSMSPPLHFSTTMDRQNRVDCLRSKSPPLHSSTTMDSLDLPSSSHFRPLIDVKGKQHKVDSLDLPSMSPPLHFSTTMDRQNRVDCLRSKSPPLHSSTTMDSLDLPSSSHFRPLIDVKGKQHKVDSLDLPSMSPPLHFSTTMDRQNRVDCLRSKSPPLHSSTTMDSLDLPSSSHLRPLIDVKGKQHKVDSLDLPSMSPPLHFSTTMDRQNRVDCLRSKSPPLHSSTTMDSLDLPSSSHFRPLIDVKGKQHKVDSLELPSMSPPLHFSTTMDRQNRVDCLRSKSPPLHSSTTMDSLDLPSSSHFRPLIDVKGKQHKVDSLDLPSMSPPLHFSTTMDRQNRVDSLRSKSPPLHSSTTMDSLDLPLSSHFRPLIDVKGKQHKVDSLDLPSMSPPLHFSTTMDRQNRVDCLRSKSPPLHSSTTMDSLDLPSSSHLRPLIDVKGKQHKVDSLELPSMSPPLHFSTTMDQQNRVDCLRSKSPPLHSSTTMDSLDLPSSSHFRPLIDVKGKQHKVDSLDLPSMSPPLHFSTTMDRQNRVDSLRSKSPPLHSSTTMDSLDLPSSSHFRPLIDVKGKQHKVDSLDLPSMSPPLHFSTTMDRQNRVDCLRSKSPPLHSSTTMDSLDLPSSSHLRPLIDVKGKQHKLDSLDLPSMSPPLHFSTTMDRQNRVDSLPSKSPPLHSSTTMNIMDSLDLPSSSHFRPLIDVKGKQHRIDSLDLPSMSPPLHFSTTMDRQNRVDSLRSKSPPLHSSTTMDRQNRIDSLGLPSSSQFRPPTDTKDKQHQHDSGLRPNEENTDKAKSTNREQRQQRESATDAIKSGVSKQAKYEVLPVVEELCKCAWNIMETGRVDTSQLKVQLTSTAENLLKSGIEAYMRSSASPEITQKFISKVDAFEKCMNTLKNTLPAPLRPLVDLITLENTVLLVNLLKKWFCNEISSKDACIQITDLIGTTIFQNPGKYVGRYVGWFVGSLIGGVGGGVGGGAAGEWIGDVVGAWLSPKITYLLWDIIKKAINYVIGFITSLFA